MTGDAYEVSLTMSLFTEFYRQSDSPPGAGMEFQRLQLSPIRLRTVDITDHHVAFRLEVEGFSLDLQHIRINDHDRWLHVCMLAAGRQTDGSVAK